MARFALFDPQAAEPRPVLGWFDTDVFAYPSMPSADRLMDVPDEVWATRTDHRMAIQGGAFVPIVEPAPAPVPRYVPLSVIRDRVTAAGRWPAFAAALDGLTAEQRWHLLTLSEGVAPDDASAVALLTAIGCDPAAVMAP